jgi:hypothetical protein
MDRALIFRIGDDGTYGGWGSEIMAEFVYDANQWVHIVGTFAYNGSNGGTGRLYADGVEVDSRTDTDGRGVANTSIELLIGKDQSAEVFDGTLDEVRTSDTARSADWVNASFLSQNGSFTFNSFTAEESAP